MQRSKIPRTGTLIWYYFICKREVWLMAHSVVPDQNHDNIVLGRWIEQRHYRREVKNINVDSVKFDIIKKKDGSIIIEEVKKSSRFIKSAQMQLAYYLWVLKQKGIKAKGMIRIPREKKTFPVVLTPSIEKELKQAIEDIFRIIEMTHPPKPVRIKYCNGCAYAQMCWA